MRIYDPYSPHSTARTRVAGPVSTAVIEVQKIPLAESVQETVAEPVPEPEQAVVGEPTVEPTPEPVEEVVEEPTVVYDVPVGTSFEVITWVDNDVDRAAAALARETADDSPRKTLIRELNRILGATAQ